MKQVIMLHSTIPRLQPNRIYSRGQVITLLPREKALVCIKVKRHYQDFCPRKPYQPPTAETVCYIVQNVSFQLIMFRNVNLHTLLSHKDITHKITFLDSKIIIKLHKQWLRGYRVWYPLRKMFVLSQYSNKVLSLY